MDTATLTPPTAEPVTPAPGSTSPSEPLTPSSPPAPTGIFSDGFTFVDGWANQLEGAEWDQARATLSKFRDFPSLAKSYVEAQKLIGQRTEGMVKLPGQDAAPEEVAAFHRALGVPESPDGYDIKIPDTLPEGLSPAPELLAPLKEKAHALGIPPAALQELVNFQIEAEARQIEEMNQQQVEEAKQARAELQREWGSRYDEKSMRARRAAETFGLGADSPVLDNPDVMRALARAADLISEDRLSGHETAASTLTPGLQARDIQMNPQNPLYKAYRDPAHPDHNSAVQTYRSLMARQIDSEK